MNVAIIGMGFVGLSLAVFLSSKNVNVFGIENNKSKLASLKHGKPSFFEPDLKKTLLLSHEDWFDHILPCLLLKILD